jgi:hypothetical protein
LIKAAEPRKNAIAWINFAIMRGRHFVQQFRITRMVDRNRPVGIAAGRFVPSENGWWSLVRGSATRAHLIPNTERAKKSTRDATFGRCKKSRMAQKATASKGFVTYIHILMLTSCLNCGKASSSSLQGTV